MLLYGVSVLFSHSLRLAGIRRLELARSTRQDLREILTPAPPGQRPHPFTVHLRMVSSLDAYANPGAFARGLLRASLWQNLSPNASVNCLLAVLLGRTAIRVSRLFLERVFVASNAPTLRHGTLGEASSFNARPS